MPLIINKKYKKFVNKAQGLKGCTQFQKAVYAAEEMDCSRDKNNNLIIDDWSTFVKAILETYLDKEINVEK